MNGKMVGSKQRQMKTVTENELIDFLHEALKIDFSVETNELGEEYSTSSWQNDNEIWDYWQLVHRYLLNHPDVVFQE